MVALTRHKTHFGVRTATAYINRYTFHQCSFAFVGQRLICLWDVLVYLSSVLMNPILCLFHEIFLYCTQNITFDSSPHISKD